ncbi:helix-turn-helix domain-containing protein [Salmonella enterica]
MRLKDLPIEVQISFKTNLEGLCVSLFGDESSTTTPTPIQPGDTLTIGARIRQLRKERMLTQAELAKSVDVQPNLVTLWENSTTEPRAKHIIPLANALKCDPMWLLSGNPLDVKAVSPATPAPVNVMKGADLANIGVRIESRRNEMGMSPLKLAEKIDTSGAMILEWEAGKAIPHSGHYDRLAKALNTTVTWLMTGKDINPAKNSAGELLGFWKAVEAAGLCGQRSIHIALPSKERVKETHEKAINNLGNLYFNEINRRAEEEKKQRALTLPKTERA